MSLLDKMAARRGAPSPKAWSQTPFWQQPDLHWGVTGPTARTETIGSDYPSYIEGAFKASPPVFNAIRFRLSVLSEARFQFRQRRGGEPGKLFGTQDLEILEKPFPNGTTSDLIARMEITASLAGNYYATMADDRGRLGRTATGPGRRIAHLRPDWVTLVIDS
ncbi:MAG: hypothetical protein ACRCZP_15455, partial [Phycicoccus sp.]